MAAKKSSLTRIPFGFKTQITKTKEKKTKKQKTVSQLLKQLSRKRGRERKCWGRGVGRYRNVAESSV